MKGRTTMRGMLNIATLLTMACVGVAWGVVEVSPPPQIFASEDGRRAFEVIPDKNIKTKRLGRHRVLQLEREATGILFTLDENGKEKVLWKRRLIGVPSEVLVHGEEYGTLDT